MSIGTGIAIYLTLWWTLLFAILPLGNKTYAEMGIEVTDGGDPGAPVNPRLGRKFFTTSWVSGIVFSIIWLAVHFGLINIHTFAAPPVTG